MKKTINSFKRKASSLTLAALLIGAGITGASNHAYAACTNPAGAAGDQMYNSDFNVMQYCDDTDWTAMRGGDLIRDADGNTRIQVEESANEDIIRFDIAGTELLTLSGNGLIYQGDGKKTYFGGTNTWVGERTNSDELSLRGGGTDTADTVFIDTSGNIGVGTASPAKNIHVYDNTENAMVIIEGSSAHKQGLHLITSGDGETSVTAAGTDGWQLYATSGANAVTADQNDITFRYYDGATSSDIMHIEHDTGNVGIGTTTPSAKLQIDSISTTADSFSQIQNNHTHTPIAETNGGNIVGFDNTLSSASTFELDYLYGINNAVNYSGSGDGNEFVGIRNFVNNTGNGAGSGFVGNNNVAYDNGTTPASYVMGSVNVASKVSAGVTATTIATQNQSLISDGTVTNAYLNKNTFSISGGSTATNAYGFHSDLINTASTVTNYYGLYLTDDSAEATNTYAIYAEGMNSYFGDAIGIGDTTPDTGVGGSAQALLLDVEGAVGATHYCDEDGENCVTAATLSSGGSNLFTDNTTHITREGFHVIDSAETTTPTSIYNSTLGTAFFLPNKKAFRGGSHNAFPYMPASTNPWLENNIGDNSFSWGLNLIASGDNSVAFGDNGGTTGNNSASFGIGSTASGYASMAAGQTSTASGGHSFALGYSSQASGYSSFAFGREVVAGTGTAQVNDATANQGNYSVAYGLGDTTGTSPRVTGTSSYGIFMGDQPNVNLTLDNSFGLYGLDRMLFDSTTGADTEQGCIRYNDTANQMEFTNDCEAGSPTWTAMGSGGGLFTDDTTHITREGFHLIDVAETTLPAALDDVGKRAFYFPDQSAFRGGQITTGNDAWQSIGPNSFAYGYNAEATGDSSIALGRGTTASSGESIALGSGSSSQSQGASAIGYFSDAVGSFSTAIGQGNDALGSSSLALGRSTIASGFHSTTMGREVIAGTGTAQGNDATANQGNYSFAVGLGEPSTATNPRVTGTSSYGIFMGDQESQDLDLDNSFGLYGLDRMLFDSVTAADTNQGCIRYNDTANQMEFTNDCEAGSPTWTAMGSGGGSIAINDLTDGVSDGSSTFLGNDSGTNDDGTANQNTGLGFESLRAVTSGIGNTGIGRRALYTTSTGGYNTAVGRQALNSNSTGASNVAIGDTSAYRNTIGFYNVAIGHSSLENNTTGTGNTVIGAQAGSDTGAQGDMDNNTVIGHKAGQAMTGGASGLGPNNNLLLGYQAGDVITTGDNNIIIGYDVDPSSATASNELNIGDLIYGDLSTGNVGIGTTAPASKLAIVETSTAFEDEAFGIDNLFTLDPTQNSEAESHGIKNQITTASAFQVDEMEGIRNNATHTGTGSSGSVLGINNYASSSGNGTNGFIAAIQNRAQSNGTNPAGTVLGSYNIATKNSTGTTAQIKSTDNRAIVNSGTVTNAYNNYNLMTLGASGAVTNAYGTYSTLTSGGSVTNYYGHYIEDSSADATNAYAIYAEGMNSYFGDAIGIGDTTPDTGVGGSAQALLLDVEGAVGATHYCDEDGENCVTAATLSSGGSNLFTDNTTHITREGFHLIDVAETTLPAALDDDGKRAFFFPDQGAFRGGAITGANDAWQDANIGLNSFGYGNSTEASGGYAIALGDNTVASGVVSTAMGSYTEASGIFSTAFGSSSTASGIYSTVFGQNSTASGARSQAMGISATASGYHSIAIGSEVFAGTGTAQANDATANQGNYSVAFGLGESGVGNDPRVTGTSSYGIFMGDQTDADLDLDNSFGLYGLDRMLFDSVTTADTNQGCIRYNDTANQMEFTNDCEAGSPTWTTMGGGGNEIADADNDTKIQVEESADEDTIRFDTAGTERMIIESDGNVGIGTASPADDLHIYNSAAAGSLILEGNNAGASALKLLTLGDGTKGITDAGTNGWSMTGYGNSYADADLQNDLEFSYFNGATQNPIMFMESTGNIGIGGTEPNAKLFVDGSSNGGVSIASFVRNNPANLSIINVKNTAPADIDNISGIYLKANSSNQERTTGAVMGQFTDITDATRTSKLSFFANDNGAWSPRMTLLGSSLGIGDDTPDTGVGGSAQALLLDVEGAVGASHYCDEDGENCVTAASLGGSEMADDDNDTKIQVEEGADDDTIRFDTAGTQRMAIDESGLIGIGANPDVLGLVNIVNGTGNAMRIQSNINNGSDIWMHATGQLSAQADFRIHMDSDGDTTTNAEFIIAEGSDTATATELFRVEEEGYARFAGGTIQLNNGLGIAANGSDIHLDGSGIISSNTVMRLNYDANNSGSGALIIGKNTQTSAATEIFRFQQDGDAVHAVGNMSSTAFCPDGVDNCDPTTNEAFNGTSIGVSNVYAGSGGEVDFLDNVNLNGNDLRSVGRLGIGQSPAAGIELDIIGDIEYTGTLTDVSDRRLKDNIGALSQKGSMLDLITQIDGVQFTMKDDEDQKIEYGVIAQDLEKSFPDLVHTAQDEMKTKSVNYIGLIAPIIEAVKELTNRVSNLFDATTKLKVENQALQTEVDTLKNQNQDILKRLEALEAQSSSDVSSNNEMPVPAS